MPRAAGRRPRTPPGNLPAPVSSFVGRRRELAEIKRLLGLSRLVTVTGVGGVGKTRVVLRAAADAHRMFPDGVWLAELSGLREPELLAHVVARALGLQDQTMRPQIDVLADFLADRRALLVLDTCEHLLDSCAILTGVLLMAAPGLHIMAASRQPLGTAEEQIFPVSPLPVPDLQRPRPDDLRQDSVVLFTERARAVEPGFAVTPGNQGAVTRLCHRLEGIPLAIELAAVWLRTLSAEQIVERLDHRLGLLSEGDPALPRHETLRAAIGWSHELCEPLERLLWARLSVFPAGFDRAAATAVCADDRLPADMVPGLLSSLVDKSLLLGEDPGEGPRFRMLDTLREYGADWLQALGDQETLLTRHRDHYLRLARRYEAEWCGPYQVEWCGRMRREHANLRAALDFCLHRPEQHHAGLDMVGTLYLYWVPAGFIREGRHYFERLIALDPPPSPALTKALWTCARLAATQGDFASVDVHLARCGPLAEEQGDRVAKASVAYIAGSVAMLRGDHERAVPLLEEATALHRDGGDPGTGLLFALALHAMTRVMRGEIEQAVALTEECHALAEHYGEGWARSFADYMRALAELARGDVGAATDYGRRALRFKALLNDSFGMALALDLLALAAGASGEAERAARTLGFADHVWDSFGLPQAGSPALMAARERCEAQARKDLGDDAYGAAFRRGQDLGLERGVAYALGDSAAG